MSDVLVTGGTGFLGQHLLRELRQAGASVRALSRSAAGDAAVAAFGAQPVRGEMTDSESLQAAVRGVRSIFHTAADTNTWRPNNDAQTRTNVEGAQALLAAARSAGVDRVLHTSSVSAYSHLVHETLREDTPQRGGESWINYERTKFLAERAVRESGLPYVIFQPSHIMGPGDTRNWSRLIRLIDQGRLPGAPPGAGPFADVREIAKAQVRAWQRGLVGESYLLGGPYIRFLDLIGKIGVQLGRPVPKRAMPTVLLRTYAQAIYGWSRLSGRMPDITPESATFTCHDLQVDCGKATRELDYRMTEIDRLLADTIAWLRSEKLIAAA